MRKEKIGQNKAFDKVMDKSSPDLVKNKNKQKKNPQAYSFMKLSKI